MNMMIRWLWMPLLIILTALQLSGCGDKQGEQRKAFIEFLQNTVLRGGERVPVLSQDQQKKFGEYVEDYAILLNFSQQMQKSVNNGLVPLLASINQIRVPQDYSSQRNYFQQALGTLILLEQQIQADKRTADSAWATRQQPKDLKPIYEQAYNKIVTQPTLAILPLLPQLNELTQNLIQVADLLNVSGDQVTYTNGGVQFASIQLVAQYNTLMVTLKARQVVLQSLRENVLKWE